jgi:protein gp37
MDGRNVESGSRLYEDQSRLQALLCREVRGTFPRCPGHPFEQGFDLRLVPHKLGEPLRWSEPRMIFVNSMSDLFQDGVPLTFISKVVSTMHLARWHTYQVLTKRSERMRELLSGSLRQVVNEAHIWWGVSVEDRKYGLPRIADL